MKNIQTRLLFTVLIISQLLCCAATYTAMTVDSLTKESYISPEMQWAVLSLHKPTHFVIDKITGAVQGIPAVNEMLNSITAQMHSMDPARKEVVQKALTAMLEATEIALAVVAIKSAYDDQQTLMQGQMPINMFKDNLIAGLNSQKNNIQTIINQVNALHNQSSSYFSWIFGSNSSNNSYTNTAINSQSVLFDETLRTISIPADRMDYIIQLNDYKKKSDATAAANLLFKQCYIAQQQHRSNPISLNQANPLNAENYIYANFPNIYVKYTNRYPICENAQALGMQARLPLQYIRQAIQTALCIANKKFAGNLSDYIPQYFTSYLDGLTSELMRYDDYVGSLCKNPNYGATPADIAKAGEWSTLSKVATTVGILAVAGTAYYFRHEIGDAGTQAIDWATGATAKKEAERLAQEKIEQEKAAAEAARIAQEKAEQERQAKLAEEKQLAEEKAKEELRIAQQKAEEAERLAQIEKEKAEEQAKADKAEQEKAEAEKQARLAEEQEKEKQRLAAEKQAQEEAQRIAQEKADKHAAENKLKADTEKLVDKLDNAQAEEKEDAWTVDELKSKVGNAVDSATNSVKNAFENASNAATNAISDVKIYFKNKKEEIRKQREKEDREAEEAEQKKKAAEDLELQIRIDEFREFNKQRLTQAAKNTTIVNQQNAIVTQIKQNDKAFEKQIIESNPQARTWYEWWNSFSSTSTVPTVNTVAALNVPIVDTKQSLHNLEITVKNELSRLEGVQPTLNKLAEDNAKKVLDIEHTIANIDKKLKSDKKELEYLINISIPEARELQRTADVNSGREPDPNRLNYDTWLTGPNPKLGLPSPMKLQEDEIIVGLFKDRKNIETNIEKLKNKHKELTTLLNGKPKQEAFNAKLARDTNQAQIDNLRAYAITVRKMIETQVLMNNIQEQKRKAFTDKEAERKKVKIQRDAEDDNLQIEMNAAELQAQQDAQTKAHNDLKTTNNANKEAYNKTMGISTPSAPQKNWLLANFAPNIGKKI